MAMPSSNTSRPLLIDLPDGHLRSVRSILGERLPGRPVRVFGSRVRGTAKPTSDLDLCIMGDDALPPAVINRLRDAFGDSRLPFKVDLAEWATMNEAFRRIVVECSVEI